MGEQGGTLIPSEGTMAREFADVLFGGLPIGFATVETDATHGTPRLSSPVLFGVPSPSAKEPGEAPQCGCRSEDLAFARVRSRRGESWTLGVRVCKTHRRLRPA
jgi:hypothetical protein